MDGTCFAILEELDRQYPRLMSFDLADAQTAEALKALSGERYIRLYMDGDADITDTGRQALDAERRRREREAAQKMAEERRIWAAEKVATRRTIFIIDALLAVVVIILSIFFRR